jgi:cytidylate kinase
MFRTITISREYASGGGMIARMIAERLGWNLLDARLVEDVARRARVPTQAAERLDEQTDPWFYPLVKGLWRGGFEAAPGSDVPWPLDAQTMAELAAEIMREAARGGKSVVVGRGGQCVLRDREDVFHVSIFAPLHQKMARLQERLGPGHDYEKILEEKDRQRATYIKRFYGENWKDRRLYHLTITSALGLETVATTILSAAGSCVATPEK